MHLSDLSLPSLQKVREYPGIRCVYRDPEKGLYYKTWSSSYVYGSYFWQAYGCDFYNTLSPIEDTIFDGNKCVGYVCRSFESVDLVTGAKHGGTALTDANLKDASFLALFNAIVKQSRSKKMIYYDLTVDNIRKKGERFVLVDLDSVIPLPEIRLDQSLRRKVVSALRFSPEAYATEIHHLIEEG